MTESSFILRNWVVNYIEWERIYNLSALASIRLPYPTHVSGVVKISSRKEGQVSLMYKGLTSMVRYAINLASYSRRCPIWGAEGARDSNKS
ncbi:hypothetical protein ES703_120048 [subsurface metagenome]